ncbi:DUF1016 N-terminal domain-containing protein [Glaciihabitans sp. UYNi722]|uniref:DUF1016 N-terminal domain-containing protein n=1 Tax=Glaciihabitans sp. UYNi722 TaxID=3156344 RepID=UPI00339120B3
MRLPDRVWRWRGIRLIKLYWQIGNEVIAQRAVRGWGSAGVGQLAADLHAEFPRITGLSRSNLFRKRAFAAGWSGENAIVQRPVGQLPWRHITVPLDNLTIRAPVIGTRQRRRRRGWSRNVLMNQIMNQTSNVAGLVLLTSLGSCRHPIRSLRSRSRKTGTPLAVSRPTICFKSPRLRRPTAHRVDQHGVAISEEVDQIPELWSVLLIVPDARSV